jgi:hypothetical protein
VNDTSLDAGRNRCVPRGLGRVVPAAVVYDENLAAQAISLEELGGRRDISGDLVAFLKCRDDDRQIHAVSASEQHHSIEGGIIRCLPLPAQKENGRVRT